MKEIPREKVTRGNGLVKTTELQQKQGVCECRRPVRAYSAEFCVEDAVAYAKRDGMFALGPF